MDGDSAARQNLIRAAEAAMARRDWAQAESLCAGWIATAAEDGEVLFLAGVAATEQQRPGVAIPRLQRAAELDPTRAARWVQLARALSLAHRTDDALAAAEHAAQLRPADALNQDTLGVVFSRADRHQQAVQLFERAAALAPGNAGSQFNLASSAKFLGRFDRAEAAYEACIAADPQFWKAYSALSQLRRQSAERNHVERLRALLATPGLSADAQLHLHLALAKELEDLNQPRAAFAHTLAGKSAKRRTLAYSICEDERMFEALHRAFPQPLAAQGAGMRDAPIFVVGMPRTGTTLVERILGSHPLLRSVGESQNFPRAVKRAAGTGSREVLDVETIERACTIDAAQIGAGYLASTQPPGDPRRLIDKLPMNFLYAGFIHRALPGARIVCLRRHPLDACLSNFRQLFALNFPYYRYACDLPDTGRYYVLFDRLIAHWRQVLPGTLLELHYEELVAGPEAQIRRLLEFCGLPWDPACLHFERNAAPVSTASAVQVRRPIYRSSVGRWRALEPELAELRALLVAAGIECG